MTASEIRLYGIRHHGPGSGRALRGALDDWRPDCVLVEGPVEGTPLLAWVRHEDLVPPVALLVTVRDDPSIQASYPFTAWSPEWVAVRWAVDHGAEVAFVDLPLAQRLALEETGPPPGADGLDVLAAMAGFSDPDAWWDHLVEHREDDTALFAAIAHAMAALRADEAGRYGVRAPVTDDVVPVEARREAAMRKAIRAARKAGWTRIAVVCGAWHVPALEDLGGVGDDAALLRGLPRVKVEAAWIPWTDARLATASGYSAGVASPRWAACVATYGSEAPIRWASRWAEAIRGAGWRASAAQVLDAVRLADQLAALRGLPRPGVVELDEAIAALFPAAAVERVRHEVRVGDGVGRVPLDAPAVPLVCAVRAAQRRLRLTASGKEREVALDLRTDRGREKSRLLHRLRILDVGWGTPEDPPDGALGTFREVWVLQWDPRCEARLVAASPWGSSPEAAASAVLVARVAGDGQLTERVADLDAAVLAGLPGAARRVLAGIDACGARTQDLAELLHALPSLARVARYGSVRGAPEDTAEVARRLLVRGLAGLPIAVRGLDDAAAADLAGAVDALREALGVLGDDTLVGRWLDLCGRLMVDDGAHPRLRGLAVRARLDAGVQVALLERAHLALSDPDPRRSAAWLEGLLSGSGLVLVYEPALWSALDAWLAGLPGEGFQQVLPILRRAFATFPPDVRRRLGVALRDGAAPEVEPPALDEARASLVDAAVAELLGVTTGSPSA